MTRPTARVLSLLELLQSGGVRTVGELADRLGVDERTVRRYAAHLIDLDVPVVSVRGRYGGYRLAAGYRMPPLMLDDDEALAVLLGLVAGRRSGVLAATGAAGETASSKIRRVLPARLADRLDALLATLAVTGSATPASPPTADVLLSLADAVRHRRPVTLAHTGRDGRVGVRALHPDGLVLHAGRWYVTGSDPDLGEHRTFRLDRVSRVTTRPGTFDLPADTATVGADPAERVLSGLATVPRRHAVSLLVRGTPEQIRTRLPPNIAVIEEPAVLPDPTRDPPADTASDTWPDRTWWRVRVQAEQLEWLPGVLAALDRPFVVEEPAELQDLVRGLADRLAASARRVRPQEDAGPEPVGP